VVFYFRSEVFVGHLLAGSFWIDFSCWFKGVGPLLSCLCMLRTFPWLTICAADCPLAVLRSRGPPFCAVGAAAPFCPHRVLLMCIVRVQWPLLLLFLLLLYVAKGTVTSFSLLSPSVGVFPSCCSSCWCFCCLKGFSLAVLLAGTFLV
jgi:hypothetical protein